MYNSADLVNHFSISCCFLLVCRTSSIAFSHFCISARPCLLSLAGALSTSQWGARISSRFDISLAPELGCGASRGSLVQSLRFAQSPNGLVTHLKVGEGESWGLRCQQLCSDSPVYFCTLLHNYFFICIFIYFVVLTCVLLYFLYLWKCFQRSVYKKTL